MAASAQVPAPTCGIDGKRIAGVAKVAYSPHRGVLMRLVFLATALAAALSPLYASARPLTLDDMYRVRDVEDARVSPDGEWVVYTVSAIDREQDQSVSDLWMSRWDGTATLQLTATVVDARGVAIPGGSFTWAR